MLSSCFALAGKVGGKGVFRAHMFRNKPLYGPSDGSTASGASAWAAVDLTFVELLIAAASKDLVAALRAPSKPLKLVQTPTAASTTSSASFAAKRPPPAASAPVRPQSVPIGAPRSATTDTRPAVVSAATTPVKRKALFSLTCFSCLVGESGSVGATKPTGLHIARKSSSDLRGKHVPHYMLIRVTESSGKQSYDVRTPNDKLMIPCSSLSVIPL